MKFWWIPEFVSVELFKVKKYGNTSEVSNFSKKTAKPKVMEKWKRLSKKSWNLKNSRV